MEICKKKEGVKGVMGWRGSKGEEERAINHNTLPPDNLHVQTKCTSSNTSVCVCAGVCTMQVPCRLAGVRKFSVAGTPHLN